MFFYSRSQGWDDIRAAGAAERRDVLSGDAAADWAPASRGSQWDPGGTDQHRSQPSRQRTGLGRSRPLLWQRQERPGQEEEVASYTIYWKVWETNRCLQPGVVHGCHLLTRVYIIVVPQKALRGEMKMWDTLRVNRGIYLHSYPP